MEGLADARKQHAGLLSEIRETWRTDDHMDFTARAMGQTITGSVRIEPTQMHLTVALPFMLAMLASKLKPQIVAEGQKLLGK